MAWDNPLIRLFNLFTILSNICCYDSEALIKITESIVFLSLSINIILWVPSIKVNVMFEVTKPIQIHPILYCQQMYVKVNDLLNHEKQFIVWIIDFVSD